MTDQEGPFPSYEHPEALMPFLRALVLAILHRAGAKVPRHAVHPTTSHDWWCAFQGGLSGDSRYYPATFKYRAAVRYGERARLSLSTAERNIIESIGAATPSVPDAPDWPAVFEIWPDVVAAAAEYGVHVPAQLQEPPPVPHAIYLGIAAEIETVWNDGLAALHAVHAELEPDLLAIQSVMEALALLEAAKYRMTAAALLQHRTTEDKKDG